MRQGATGLTSAEVPELRILHVVATDQRRGAETFASDLVRALADGSAAQHVAILRPSVPDGVTFDAPTVPLDGWGRRVPGVRIDVGRVRALRALIRTWHPTVIQAHGGEPLKYSVSATIRVPIVYRRIGQAMPGTRHGLQRVAYGILMRRAARVVAVADVVRNETIRTFGIASGRAITIAGGVDAGRLKPERTRETVRRQLGIPPDAPTILSLGSLSWEKDPLAHVRVGRKVLEQVPDAVHVFAGDGPLRDEVEAAIRSSGSPDRFFVLGSRRDVADLLAATDVLLFVSRPDGMEGMPACLIEAGMSGLPVVAYPISGVPELVEDRVTGILVPSGDEGGVQRAVVRLLEDAALRHRLGTAARDRCLSAFDVRILAGRYLELYRDLGRAA